MKLINSTVPAGRAPGELYSIASDDDVNMRVLHTWGTRSEM